MKAQMIVGFTVVHFLSIFLARPVFAQAGSETEIIFDDSGSMNEAKNGVVKLDMAQEALTTIAGQIPGGSCHPLPPHRPQGRRDRGLHWHPDRKKKLLALEGA